MNNPFEGKETLWVVHIGNHDGIAIRARNEGFVCIGWTKMGDLSPFGTRQKMRERMEETFRSWRLVKLLSVEYPGPTALPMMMPSSCRTTIATHGV